ncbi:MAG: glycoside hydrolase family 3 C-terminal domain-containing protein, partial [Cyclobacteriaceae bacterium]
MTDEHVQLAREVAKRSIVLLKNTKKILPLDAEKKANVAVIGPLAKDKDTPLGNWRAAAIKNSAVSLYEGIENAIGSNVNLTYAKGCELSVGENNFFNELTIEEGDRSMFRQAIRTARKADVVIMALGEPAYMSGEARSRSEISMPGLQLELLKEIRKVNDNVVLVLMNGRPLTIQWEAENIPAIVEAWHLGSEAGNAIADVLFGKYNPSGKLPMSFPKSVGQIPVFYNHKATGRPSTDPGMVFYTHYMDVDNSALFPFGYGLSYSQFDYSNLRTNNTEMKPDGTITVSVDVKNSSDVDGEEVVQLYLRDLVSSVTRPVKELKKFEKVMIKGGETKTITFELNNNDLSFYRKDLSFGSEAGKFKVFVGGNSADLLESKFSLVE